MTKISQKLIVVMPIYEDRDASTQLFADLYKCYKNQIYIIAVDDGSVNSPVRTEDIESAGLEGVIIKLRRNVGHQRAIAIGLGYASEHIQEHQYVVVLDSDGEDRPSSIDQLVQALDNSENDIAVAQRKSRIESLKFKLFYSLYKKLFLIFAGREIGFGNFMAIKKHGLMRLVCMQELPIHIASTVLASKLRITQVPIDRGARYAGQSKMNFFSLALHGFKGLMVFAEDVLVRVGVTCAFIAVCSVLGGVTAICLKIAGYSTPGWFSVALGILVLMFLQTGALTLMTLMMTGIVRSGTVASPVTYHQFIDEVLRVSPRQG